MTILSKNVSGTYVLGLSIGGLSFDWFTEDGEWYIYFHLFTRKATRVLRLSSVGCYCQRYEH